MNLIDKILLESKVLTETVINALPKDINTKKKYADEVWDILQKSYAKIGGLKGNGFNSKEDMIKNIPFWKMVKQHGRIICVVLYKDKNGRKRVAGGTDGTQEGVFAFKHIGKEEIKTERSYGEISGPVLSLQFKQIPNLDKYAIPFDKVSDILGDEIRKPEPDDKYLEKYPTLAKFFYQREIGGSWETKIMVGKPGQNFY